MPAAEIESLATALAHLQDEKRRCGVEEAKTKEALCRRRDRYDRERQLISRMTDELSKSREAFVAAKNKTQSTVGKMSAAVDANETVKRAFENAEEEMEKRREVRRKDAAEKAKDAASLMEEMMRKREETRREKAREAMEAIEWELGDGAGGKFAEEIRRFEDEEKTDGVVLGGARNVVYAAGAAFDAIDALREGAAALGKEGAVLEELAMKADGLVERLEKERQMSAGRERVSAE